MLERLYISTEEYFKLPYASNSGIKDSHKLFIGKSTEELASQTRAYNFGSALDALLTDPDNMDTSMLSDIERSIITPMARNLKKNSIYKALFMNAERQAVWVDQEFPISFDGLELTIPVKSKFDWWNPKFKFGGDLKTTMAKDENQFYSAAKWFDYDQQAAWYMDITGSDYFVILAPSKKANKVFEVPFKRGDKGHLQGREKYIRCAASWWKLHGVMLGK